MADRDPGTDDSARRTPERAWTQPLRRVVTLMTGNGDTYPDEAEPAPVTGEWLVDCAVYLHGVRQPGRPTYAEAYAEASQSDGGFVWLGLHEPPEAKMADVAAVFGLDDFAVEHALTARTRPKIEQVGEQVTFFALRTARYVEHTELTETADIVETGNVLMFIGARFVITVRHGEPGPLRPVRSDLEAPPRPARAGALGGRLRRL